MQVGFNQLNNVNFKGTIKVGEKNIDTNDVKRITGNDSITTFIKKNGEVVYAGVSQSEGMNAFFKARKGKDITIDLYA